MYERIQNADPKEFLIKKIKENSKSFGNIVVKAILFREKGSTYLYYGKINFLHKSENSSSSFTNDYGPVILLQWVTDNEGLLKFIESLSTENIVLNEFMNIKIKGGLVQECYHVANGFEYAGVRNDWPFWLARYDYDSNLGVHYNESRDSLTAPGLDPYPDLYVAAEKFLNLEYRPDQNTPIGFQFIIPDYRARIKTIEIEEKNITILIEKKEISIEDLLLQFYGTNDIDHHHLKEVKIEQNGEAKITLPFVPKEGHTFLLEKKSGMEIDSKSFGKWYSDRTKGIIFKTSKETIESMIAKGENNEIEFKMDIGKDINDFLETAVAFANTKGGTILLGVHNDRGVVGIDDDFEKLDQRIRSLVANRCEPDVNINIEPFVIDNRNVVAVTVKEGNDKPYLLIDKSAYKRVMKDDYTLTRHDFDELYSKKQQRSSGSGIV